MSASRPESVNIKRVEYFCNRLLNDFDKTFADGCKLKSEDLRTIPFGKILLPFVINASEQLNRKQEYASAPPEVRGGCQRQLLSRLSKLASQTLFFHFSLFRSPRKHLLLFSGSQSDYLYEEFVETMYKGKLISLLEDFKELELCINRLLEMWLDSSGEFFDRLSADKKRIKQHLLPSEDPADLLAGR